MNVNSTVMRPGHHTQLREAFEDLILDAQPYTLVIISEGTDPDDPNMPDVRLLSGGGVSDAADVVNRLTLARRAAQIVAEHESDAEAAKLSTTRKAAKR